MYPVRSRTRISLSRGKAVARQFQAAGKLPYMSWVLPHALDNRDVMSTAWYLPTRLTAIASSRLKLEDDEDEDGIKSSMESLVS